MSSNLVLSAHPQTWLEHGVLLNLVPDAHPDNIVA